MQIRRLCAIVLLVSAARAQVRHSAGAGEPASVTIQQVAVSGHEVKAYLDVLDQYRVPVKGLRLKDFSANLAGERRPVTSLVAFDGSGEPTAYMVMVDVSGSIQGGRIDEIRSAVTLWAQSMSDADKMAIYIFGDKARLHQDFAQKEAVLQSLEKLPKGESKTVLYASIEDAIRLTYSRTDLPSRRVIVLLTDGEDDDPAHSSSQAAVEAAIENQPIPIFAIGVPLQPDKRRRRDPLDVLSAFSARSHGLFLPMRSRSIRETYDEMRAAIRRVYVAKVECVNCSTDGRPIGLRMQVRNSLSGNVLVDFNPPPPDKSWMRWAAGGAAFLVIVASVLTWRFRRKPPKSFVQPSPAFPTPEPVPSPIPVAKANLTFVVVGIRGKRYEVPLFDKVVVGKDRSCHVCLPGDNTIADRHCEVFQQSGRLFVTNVAASHPTMVNGSIVRSPRTFEPEDILRLGRTELRVLVSRPK